METLAYIHIALAYEEAVAPQVRQECNTETLPVLESVKLFEGIVWQKLSSRAWMYFLSIAVTLGFLGIASKALAQLQQGSSGPEVTALQQRLQQQGYLGGRITGNFGPATRDAVIGFQKDKGLTPNGVVGSETQAALRGNRVRRQAQVVSQRRRNNQQQSYSASSTRRSKNISQQDDNSGATKQPTENIVARGDRGSAVTTIQQRLRAAGVYDGPTNGVFDAATEAAVKQFQQANNLTADGLVGSRTEAVLRGNRARRQGQAVSQRRTNNQQLAYNTTATKPSRNIVRQESSTPAPKQPAENVLGRGDRGSAVTALQERLKTAGVYNGPSNGVFDADTEAAVKEFQQANKLAADGLVGRQTMAKIVAIAKPPAGLKPGDKGSEVVNIQQRLRDLGYFKGRLSGEFDEDTKNAIIDFQQAEKLPTDGVAGQNTVVAINKTTERFSLLALQKRLQEKGFYSGPLDGVLNAQTKQAIASAQQAYGVSADDIINGRY